MGRELCRWLQSRQEKGYAASGSCICPTGRFHQRAGGNITRAFLPSSAGPLIGLLEVDGFYPPGVGHNGEDLLRVMEDLEIEVSCCCVALAQGHSGGV